MLISCPIPVLWHTKYQLEVGCCHWLHLESTYSWPSAPTLTPTPPCSLCSSAVGGRQASAELRVALLVAPEKGEPAGGRLHLSGSPGTAHPLHLLGEAEKHSGFHSSAFPASTPATKMRRSGYRLIAAQRHLLLAGRPQAGG